MLFSRLSARAARILATVFLASTLLLAAGLGVSWVYAWKLVKGSTPAPPEPIQALLPAPSQVSPLQVRYQLDVPGRGEIFPSLSANARDYWPVAVLTISNSSQRPLIQVISAEITGWSARAEQKVVIGARETRVVDVTPELLPQAYANNEMRQVTLRVHVTGPGQDFGYQQKRPVFLHAATDLYWGSKFSNAQFIARWVTPHDPAVLRLVSEARQYIPRGRMAGYHLASNVRGNLSQQVRAQANAVFDAMKRSGISYVDSIFTFGNYTGEAQRVRLPRETLSLSSANCIDVSVAFASAMENLGMMPVIVIVPGHAFAGVRLGPDSQQILYLDLTVLPNGTFAQAVARANHWLKTVPSERVLVIDISAARALGIYPMPDPLEEIAAFGAKRVGTAQEPSSF
jgi:hypothetical protein